MEKKQKKIPKKWDEKIMVWEKWATGTSWNHIPAYFCKEFDLTDYRCRKLKLEFENLTLDQLSSLDNHSVIQTRHPKFLEYQKRKKTQTSEPAKSFSLDTHLEELADCAKELATRLEQIQEWGDLTIGEGLFDPVSEDDFDLIEFFNKKITIGLLAHLRESMFVPGLAKLSCWDDLEVSTIDEHFLKMIRLEAALRQFEGKCELCP